MGISEFQKPPHAKAGVQKRPITVDERMGIARCLADVAGWGSIPDAARVVDRIVHLAHLGESAESIMRRLNPPARVVEPPSFARSSLDVRREPAPPAPAPPPIAESAPALPEVLPDAARPVPARRSADGRTETLTCVSCGKEWVRVVVPARKPKRCAACR
jgi:hypothetical protein